MSRGSGDSFQFIEHEVKQREFIALGLPTFGYVNIYWASRVFGMLRHPMNRDLHNYIIKGDEVGLARNEIVRRALEHEEMDARKRCSHVFFIDDDVLIHPDALLQLMSRDLPIVSGLYFAKTSVPQALILHGEAAGVETKWRPGDLVNCWAHGMGLTLIKADVFRRMRDELDLGTDSNGNPEWFKTVRDSKVLRTDGVPAFTNWTEDVYFLRMASELGYQPCVDTSAQAFGFHWAEKENRAYPLKQWSEYRDKGTITWTDTPDGAPVVWSDAA
jgi:hypothetical protein